MKAGDLTVEQLGHKVRATSQSIEAVGQLAGVAHRADVIEERPLSNYENDYILGRRWVDLTFANGSVVKILPTDNVEILSK